MTETAKERIEEEIKEAELSYKMNDRRCGDYIAGTLKGLNIALAHIQNATTLVTSDETVTIGKEVYDLLINKVNKQREQLATAVEALEEIRGVAINNYHDMRMNIVGGKVREALAEIGGQNEEEKNN